MRWPEQVHDRATVDDVAEALGLVVRAKGRNRGFTCPIHNADHRDGTPSGRIVHGGQGWRCWSCDKGGDAVTLAAQVLEGTMTPRGGTFHRLRDWFAARGWCDAYDGAQTPVDGPVVDAGPILPPQTPPPARHAPESVRTLWQSAESAHGNLRTYRWLHTRGLEAWRVQVLDVARALPADAVCPTWAGFGKGDRWRSWASAGWSLLLPTYDSRGEMVGLRARWTGTEEVELDKVPDGYRVEGGPEADAEDMSTYLDVGPPMQRVQTAPPFAGKEVSPKGIGGRGAVRASVYACPVGRWLLAGGRGPVDADAPGMEWSGEVIIVEGGPAFLRYATEPGRVQVEDGKARTYALLGVWSGAWPDDSHGRSLAYRLARARRVVVAPDADGGGAQIARPIVESLKAVGVDCAVLEAQ